MARTNLSNDDTGKRVINASGEEIGVVSGVSGNMAYVDPDPGLTDTIKSKLGWEDVDEGDFVLQDEHVMRVTDDKIRLKDQY